MIGNVMLVTACPECNTTFRITVGILEKAGGQVRCGRCAMIFDANVKLREIDESQVEFRPASDFKFELQPDADPHAVTDPNVEVDLPDEAVEADASPPDEAPDQDSVEAVALADEADAVENTDQGAAERDVEAAARDDSTDATDEAPAETASRDDAADDEVAALAEAASDAADDAAAERDEAAEADAAAREAGTPATDAEVAATPDEPDWLPPIATSEERRTWPWAAGTAAAALLLVGQLVHHYRSELVTVPAFGPVLSLVYAGLGAEILPAVDLDQYDLLDLTAVAQPSGEDQGWLVIETRVHNSGPNVQPYPYILVRLLDRWEDTIAARYFAPEEYGLTSIRDASRMNIGSTLDAQFIIMDPGPSATGFELELCAKSQNGFECESDNDDE
jgi:predicted Zn finger-like uncharacterized protein